MRWRNKHPDLIRARNGRTHAKERGAQVLGPIKETVPFYAEAHRLTRETGILHEVDHIIPIAKGGPHAPWNLMVLTADENSRKGDGYFI